MTHGTWTTTGGGTAITAGGVLAIIGGVVVLANLHAIERAAGELVAVLAVTVLVFLAVAVTGLALLGMWFRRNEGRFTDHLAERRRAAMSAAVPAVPAPAVRALPVAQPQTVIHHHWHGDAGTQMLRVISENGQAGGQR